MSAKLAISLSSEVDFDFEGLPEPGKILKRLPYSSVVIPVTEAVALNCSGVKASSHSISPLFSAVFIYVDGVLFLLASRVAALRTWV